MTSGDLAMVLVVAIVVLGIVVCAVSRHIREARIGVARANADSARTTAVLGKPDRYVNPGN